MTNLPQSSAETPQIYKGHIEQKSKQRSQSQVTSQPMQNALLLAYAAALFQHSFTFSEGAIFKLNVISQMLRMEPVSAGNKGLVF